MAQRCVNCYISSHRHKRFSSGSESEELKHLIQSWIAPQALSHEDVLCHECWLLGRKALESNDHTRCFGHARVCIGCGKSTSNHSRSIKRFRAYNLLVDGIPNATYFQLISEWIAPKQITESSSICYACCLRAKRWVKRKEVPPKLSINNLCRVCLRQNDDMLCIFDENHKIHHKIEFCIGIQITNDSDTPTKICISCYSDLSTAFEFKTSFFKSNDKLSTLLSNRAAKRKLTLTPDSGSTEKKIKKGFGVVLKFADVPVPFDYNEGALTLPIENTDGYFKHEVVIEEPDAATGLNTLNDNSFDGDLENDDFEDLNQNVNDEKDVAAKRKLTLTPDSGSTEKKIKKGFGVVLKFADVPVPFDYNEEALTLPIENTDGSVKHEVVVDENLTSDTNIDDYSFNVDFDYLDSAYSNRCIDDEEEITEQKQTSAKVSKSRELPRLVLKTCKTCCEEFTTFADYKRHLPKHFKTKFECEQCNEIFPSYSSRRNHLLKHFGIGYNCDQCSYKTHNKANLNDHLNNMHRNRERKKPTCQVCRAVFPTNKQRDDHFNEEHLYKRWFCELCKRILYEEKEDHMLLHSAPQFECHDCGHKSYTKENIQAHIMKIHLGIVEPKKPRPRKLPKRREYPCDICKTKFATWQALMLHQKEHRPGYWICPICGAKGKSSLKNHMLRHTAPQLECDYCRKLFYERRDLVRHIKMQHLKNSRKYQCEICSKYMVTKANLKTHQRNVHLKEKNYQCPECGVWKFNKAQLKNHMFKHNGVKDLKCELCDAAYARITYLKNHMLRDHGITVPNCKTSKTVLETSSEFIRRYLISIGRLK